MQRELEIVAPVAALVTVVGQDRVVEENFQSVEVGPQPVENDDVRRDDEKVARERRVGFVELVEETPRDEQRENFGFPRARCHFQDVTRPIFGEHAGGNRAGGIEAKQIEFVAGAPDFVKPDDRFDRFALGEVVAER